ncbi:MAG: cytidylate kinase family protein [Candidatus Lokiarchaeota archaeon]|nr:cytidylate kinase family protein [Candidatus Lokiarchaeota archaeon]
MIIAISGLHGTGKSVVGKKIAEKLGLAYYSTGDLFRAIAQEKGLSLEDLSNLAEKDKTIDYTIDYRIKQLALKGNCVLDNQLSSYLLKDLVDYSVLLACDEEIRIKRMKERDKEELGAKIQETQVRERSERKRFLEFYGIDIHDPDKIKETFDLILDTTHLSIEEVTSKILTAIQEQEGFSLKDPKN